MSFDPTVWPTFAELEQDTEEINQHEQEDFVERGSCLVNVRPEVFERLQVCDDDERADTFADVLRDVFPNCALRFGGLEATCKIKSSKLMIRITLSEDQQRLDPYTVLRAPQNLPQPLPRGQS